MKIKLKDMTEEQYRKWKEEKCSSEICEDCIFCKVICGRFDDNNWINNKDLYSDKFLNQEVEIEDENLQSNNNI